MRSLCPVSSLSSLLRQSNRCAGALLLALVAACQRPPAVGNALFDQIWFSADRRTALTFGEGIRHGALHRWDVRTGALLRTLPPAKLSSRDSRWWVSPDLSFAAIGHILWDLDAGRERAVLGEANEIEAVVALAPDGQEVYALTADSIVAFSTRDGARRGAVRRPVRGAGVIFGATAMSGDGRALAFLSGTSGRSDARVYLLRLPDLAVEELSWQPPAVVPGGGAWTQGMLFSPDGRTLAISSGFQEVALYDVTTRRVRQTLHCKLSVPLRPAVPVGFSRDGTRLVVHEDPEYPGLCIFDVMTGQLVKRIAEPPDYDRRLMPTMGERTLVVRRHGLGPFEVYRLSDGELLRTFCPLPAGCQPGTGPQNRHVGLAPGDTSLFVSQSAHVAAVFDATTGERRSLLVDPSLPRAWESPGARARAVFDRALRALFKLVA